MGNYKHKTGDKVIINYVGKAGCYDSLYLANKGKIATIKNYFGYGLYELVEFPEKYWSSSLLQKVK